MKVFSYIAFVFIINSTMNNDNSFILGSWEGKESVHIKVSELSIDKWIDIKFQVDFRANKSFRIETGKFLYNIVLDDYKKENNLDFNSYTLKEDEKGNHYILELFNNGTEKKVSHKLRKVNTNEIILVVLLENGESKDIVLNKIK